MQEPLPVDAALPALAKAHFEALAAALARVGLQGARAVDAAVLAMTREAIARHSSVGTRQYATSTARRAGARCRASRLVRPASPPAPQRAVSASQGSALGSGAQGNEVNRSLKSVWFAAPPSM